MLKLPYNNKGFNAFVTDANLAHVHISHTLPPNLNRNNCRGVMDPENTLAEIRKTNNVVKLQ